MMDGKRITASNPTSATKGTYIFLEECHCLRTLALLEKEIELEIEGVEEKIKESDSIKEREQLQEELASLHQDQKNLFECLMGAKKDFENAVASFIGNARNAKEPMTVLIRESCDNHGCPDSLLLDWAQMEGEDEEESFQQKVIDFATFYRFCGDLAHFLEDLVRSCPKAQAQFKKLIADEKNKNATR